MLKLTLRNVLVQWKKSLATIISICLGVALIFTSVSIYYSYEKMRHENVYNSYGRYNVVLHNINQNQKDMLLRVLSGMNVEIGVEGIYDSLFHFALVSPDDNAMSMNYYSLSEGELPREEGQIAISPTYMYGDEYIIFSKQIGDSIEINGEEYIITGFLEDYDYSTVDLYKMGIIYGDQKVKRYNVYIHFDSFKYYDNTIKRICRELQIDKARTTEGDKAYGFWDNYILIENSVVNLVDIEDIAINNEKNISRLIIIFGLIIIIMSIVLNIHVFYSYFGKRNTQSEILKSIGFSSIQIIGVYILESIILVLLGTIIGLASGTVISVFITEFVQKSRIEKLVNFNACLEQQIYLFACGISFVSFIGGAIPAILGNSLQSIDKLKRNKKKKHKGILDYFLTIKIFCEDEKEHRIEKYTTYFVLIIASIVVVLSSYAGKFVNNYIKNLEKEEIRNAEFYIVVDEMSTMDMVRQGLEGITYYDVLYNTMVRFQINEDDVNEAWRQALSRDESGNIACEVFSVNEEEYYSRFTISDEMTYEEFVNSGGAFLIDNSGGSSILNEDLKEVSYVKRDDEVCSFPAGSLSIVGRSNYREKMGSSELSFVVPEKLYLEKFDYTVAMVKINVEAGYEVDTANYLAKCRHKYDGFNFEDNVTEYIYANDNRATIDIYSRLAIIFIMACTFISLYYINKHRFYRQGEYYKILEIIGRSVVSLNITQLFMSMFKVIPSAIIANFIINVYCKKKLDPITFNALCGDFVGDVIACVIVLAVIQLISHLHILIRLRKQKIIQ
ncbi:MAG: FtsX-like permease family protein [Wujia sp.]